VFFVGTSNDVSRLPPELSRAERFDGVFFLDLPGTAERDAIWPLYLRRYGVEEPADRRPTDRDWTGAEIAACCRLSALLGVPLREAATHVVPVAVTAAEQVESLRNWASGRCLSASQPGVYTRGGGPAGQAPKAGRRVSRPSAN
jgi:SpoVK/Ycf46/Vps4 family AAA+-type ATPase